MNPGLRTTPDDVNPSFANDAKDGFTVAGD